MELIDKEKVITEIKRLLDKYISVYTFNYGATQDLNHLLNFLDTIEVKQLYEHNDADLDLIIEEIGIEPDSKLAKMVKTAFYKGIDSYLAKKGE